MIELYSRLSFAPIAHASSPCRSRRNMRGGSRRFFAGRLAGRYDPARSERSSASGGAMSEGRDAKAAAVPEGNPGAGVDTRVAVVSGGGSGIGRAIALELARRGFALALLGRRLAPLEETLAAAGLLASPAGLALACDVRDAAAVGRAAAAVEARWGAAEVVVPAAGAAYIRPFVELPAEQFAATL